MAKKITDITVFIDFVVNEENGREYVDHASVQVRDDSFDLVAHVTFNWVVRTETDLWNHVEKTIKDLVAEGHEVDNPKTFVWRSHKTRLRVDYFEAIGQHL